MVFFSIILCNYFRYSKDEDDFIDKVDKINIRCAGITDNDPDKELYPTPTNPETGKQMSLFD